MSEIKLTNDVVLERIQSKIGTSLIGNEVLYDTLVIEIDKSVSHELIQFLKEDEVLNISFLTLLGAVHYPDKKGKELCVVYHLHSLVHNYRIRIKTYLSIDFPEIESIVDLYAGANWLERETYDFFGVIFKGHPNLTRILNEDSMDYFPMRKDYQLEDGTRTDKDDRFFGR